MNKGDSVVEISTGDEYVVFESDGDEICILQFFPYAEYPYNRQLKIWIPKERFIKVTHF